MDADDNSEISLRELERWIESGPQRRVAAMEGEDEVKALRQRVAELEAAQVGRGLTPVLRSVTTSMYTGLGPVQ